MCCDGWCHREALHLVSASLDAVEAGSPMPWALGAGLATVLEVSTIAYVRVDLPAWDFRVTSWPGATGTRIPGAVVERLFLTFPPLRARTVTDHEPWRAPADVDPAAWRAWVTHATPGLPELAELSLHVSDRQVRLLLLGRPREFSEREMHLLSHARPALSTLDRMHLRPAAAADAAPEVPELTCREVQVLVMLAEGLLARTMAARLNVSTRTVHKHLGNVYRKLGAHDRLLAVDQARRLGLLPPRPHSRAAGL